MAPARQLQIVMRGGLQTVAHEISALRNRFVAQHGVFGKIFAQNLADGFAIQSSIRGYRGIAWFRQAIGGTIGGNSQFVGQAMQGLRQILFSGG